MSWKCPTCNSTLDDRTGDNIVEARQAHTNEELKEMAWHFAHDNFTAFGSPKFYDAALAELLYEMLVKARDGKTPF